jgi:hypothetical protein
VWRRRHGATLCDFDLLEPDGQDLRRLAAENDMGWICSPIRRQQLARR